MIDIDKTKKDIVQKLKPLNLDKIILFGSYAYGTPNEDSDLDICIIDDNFTSKIDKKLEIRKKLKEIKIAKDILLVDNNYYLSHSDKNWLNTALYDVRHKGEVLHEKI
ncbi:MAG: hypothetical protein DRG78_01880 [Epsilonproteobacteria bacterium]|nr:MAG: hypothetical protein DRG78_01880 [Campylobacterota bacterium]